MSLNSLLKEIRIVPAVPSIRCVQLLRLSRTVAVCFALFSLIGYFAEAKAQNNRCDPTKVLGAESCARCHVNESAAWKLTPHYQTFESLSRNPAAQEICHKLGLRSVKRSDVCIECHFTTQQVDQKLKPIAGVSCESCHGAAADWINIHNQLLSPSGSRDSETPEQSMIRLIHSTDQGMNNTRNIYRIASNCLNCHTIANERLVNVGGHQATSVEFEFVAWSQGLVRHNFLRSNGHVNGNSSRQRLRLMYVVGLIADLEFSLRATAQATEKSIYGITVAGRAAEKALALYQLQQQLNDPHVQEVLLAFAQAELRLNNQASLLAIAQQIGQIGERFAEENDGQQLAAVDPFLPDPSQYR